MAATLVKCMLEDVKPLVAALDGVAAFRQDAALVFGDDGLGVTAVDDNRVMLIDFAYAKSDMAGYGLGAPGTEVRFAADLRGLAGVLKLGLKRGEAMMSIKAGSPALEVTLANSVFSVQPKQHDGRLVDTVLEPPSDRPDVVVCMSTKEAKRVFKELLALGGDVEFAFDPKALRCRVLCTGPAGSAAVDLQKEVHGVSYVAGSEALTQKFDSKYVQKLVNKDLGNKEVTISLRRGMPLEIRHTFGECSRVAFYLAPKLS